MRETAKFGLVGWPRSAHALVEPRRIPRQTKSERVFPTGAVTFSGWVAVVKLPLAWVLWGSALVDWGGEQAGARSEGVLLRTRLLSFFYRCWLDVDLGQSVHGMWRAPLSSRNRGLAG